MIGTIEELRMLIKDASMQRPHLLGQESIAELVVVTFPSGQTVEIRNVDANQELVVVEPVVSVEFDLDSISVAPGASFSVPVTLTNLTGVPQSRRYWSATVVAVANTPGGTTAVRRGYACTARCLKKNGRWLVDLATATEGARKK